MATRIGFLFSLIGALSFFALGTWLQDDFGEPRITWIAGYGMAIVFIAMAAWLLIAALSGRGEGIK